MNGLLFCLFLLLLIVWPYSAPLHPDAAEEEEGAKVTPPETVTVTGEFKVGRK